MTVRDTLKRATSEVHDRLDASLSAYRLDDRDDYHAFLAAQAAAFLPIERALTGAGAGALVANWAESLRGPLLAADLVELGADTIPEVAPPLYDDEAALLGGLYVLEGSRMGAAVLAREVPAGFPRRFLSARPPAGHWGMIVATLEASLGTIADLTRAKAAAQLTFECFERVAGVKRG